MRQLGGEYRGTEEKLRRFIGATGLLRQFGSYRIVHSRREFNEAADRLTNCGIDTQVNRAWARVDQAIASARAEEESPDSIGQGGR